MLNKQKSKNHETIQSKSLPFLFIGLISTFSLQAQKYMTKNGNIKFYSETPMETIEATNNQVNAALDTQTGDLVFKVLIKSFQFEKALMQEHFNENYMESDKMPNSTFKGKVTNLSAIDFTKEGTYEASDRRRSDHSRCNEEDQ